MRTSRLLIHVLLLILALPGSGLAASRDDLMRVFADIVPRKYTRGIFWKIEKPGLRPSYLLGTIHVDDPRVTRLPPVIQRAFDGAQTVCTEVKMDFRMLEMELKSMYFQDGRSLKTLLPKRLYQATARLMKRYGLPPGSFDRMKPFAVAYLLNIPPRYVGAQMLDMRLYTSAISRNKQVCGLETAAEHGAAFDFLDMREQVNMLRQTVNNIEQVHASFRRLLQAWLDRDLKAMVTVGARSNWTGDLASAKKLVDWLIVRRNRIMHRRMQPWLRRGNTFFAVGTLHLTGRLGLLRLLEGSGYRVTRLY